MAVQPPLQQPFPKRALFSLLVLAAATAPAQEPMPGSAVDRESAALARAWLRDAPPPPVAESEVEAAAPSIEAWRRYVAIGSLPPDARVDALRRLYNDTDSQLLRSRILQAVAGDPAHQSRQAEFVRRYGFFANWFNRLFYSAGRLIQGKVQAGVQLVVDAVYDLTTPREADAATRRAYERLSRAVEQGRTDASAEEERLRVLRERVERALAAEDYERAEWALRTRIPEAAVYYAAQAELRRPGWKRAERLRTEAEAEVARRRRESVASRQVGYPDRPLRASDAEWAAARGLLAVGSTRPTGAGDDIDLVARLFAAPPYEPDVARMRRWQQTLAARVWPATPTRAWVVATLETPQTNPDLVLSEALMRRRGEVMRFIFLGPESPRRQSYKAASWTAQSLQALQNVGFFYVFEVVARGVQSIWAAPAPESAYLDAMTRWLAAAPRPLDEKGRRHARRLADLHLENLRFDDARAVLRDAGLLDEATARRIDRTEARRYVAAAEATTDPELRELLLAEARRLSPAVAADFRERRRRAPEPLQLQVSWEAVVRWTDQPLPAGLPGTPDWFDGHLSNGEAGRSGLHIEETGTPGRWRFTYDVFYKTELRIHQEEIDAGALPPRVREWIELAFRQQREAEGVIESLDRLPIPFAVEGGAGPSGVDLYPELRPIQLPGEDLRLYQ